MSNIPTKTIAILQIIGGVAGIVFMPWTQIPNINIFSLPVIILEILIDLLAIAAGIALWCETSFGRKASVAVQLIQLPKITSPAILFMFSFGLDFWVHASPSGIVGFQFSVFCTQIVLNVPNAPVDFGVSVTAIIALVKKRYGLPLILLSGTVFVTYCGLSLDDLRRIWANAGRDMAWSFGSICTSTRTTGFSSLS